MDKLIYIGYLILIGILLWGAKFYRKNSWNDNFISLKQTKALQGFCAICIMLHHIGQKTCGSWLRPMFIVHGLDVFVPIGYYFVGIFLFCSGYGLYKSYKTKQNYLKDFVERRILPIVLAYYSTSFIYLITRILMKEKLSLPQLVFHIIGLQLNHSNAWFAVALPIFYIGFYFSFKYVKREKIAFLSTCLYVCTYVLIGTVVGYNDWWLCGPWWYNSAHCFILGLLFARHEQDVIKHVKKQYGLYVTIAFMGIPLFYILSDRALIVFPYSEGEYKLSIKLACRWICLMSQILASSAFVIFVFLVGLKVKIENKILAFMGTITLEFYLIHSLFVELFGYCFIDEQIVSLFYVRNVAFMVLVVLVLSIPSALLLQKWHKWIRSFWQRIKVAQGDLSNDHHMVR